MNAAMHRAQPGSAPPEVHWTDRLPRTVVSTDGVQLVHILPGLLSQKTTVK